MVFNSLQYALFLPVMVAGHWLLPRRLRIPWLLAGSYVFYGAWDWRFLGLIWLTTTVDFLIGLGLGRIEEDRRRRRLLFVSVAANLGILGFFKYFDFFVGSAADLLGRIGLEGNEPALRVILPVGISFYTFQSLSYTIDVYRRRMEPCRDPILFATFVAFFPQLVAGPIERATHLLPQLAAERHPPSYDRVESSILLILMGLTKKVVIGDTMAPIVDQVFADPGSLGSVGLAVGVVAFAIQIYADFSAYTDIARGSARLFGVELMHNFHQPYLARDVTEFWRRWHISLSTWLRDYLYVPLGGNRRGPVRTYVNLFVTMLLGGLWHGAAWTFVIWGGLHGLYLAVHRAFRVGVTHAERLPTRPRELVSVAGTFVLVCIAWVFFRASSVGNARQVLEGIARLETGALPGNWILVVVMAATALGVDLVTRLHFTRGARPERSAIFVGAAAGVAIVGLLVFSGTDPVPFVYFQF